MAKSEEQTKEPGAGRPPDITEDRLQRLAVCRIMNLNLERTASFMGIAKNTLYYWMDKAKKIQQLVDSNEPGLLTEYDRRYLKFSHVWDNAKAELVSGCISGLVNHGKRHHQPLEWLLERLDPDQWARFEAKPVPIKLGEVQEPIITEDQKEFDPYERTARAYLSLKEAGFLTQTAIREIIESANAADAEDEVSSGNGHA